MVRYVRMTATVFISVLQKSHIVSLAKSAANASGHMGQCVHKFAGFYFFVKYGDEAPGLI